MKKKPKNHTIYISMLGELLVKIKIVRRKIRSGNKIKNKLTGCPELSEKFKKFVEKERNKTEE